MVGGAALIVASASIHIHLWAEKGGYKHIPSIGPLFLAQAIVGGVLAVALVAFRRPLLAALGALYLAGSIGGLLISLNWGLFGYTESTRAPYVGLALVVEPIGVVVLVASVLAGPGLLVKRRVPSTRSA